MITKIEILRELGRYEECIAMADECTKRIKRYIERLQLYDRLHKGTDKYCIRKKVKYEGLIKSIKMIRSLALRRSNIVKRIG